MSQKRGGSIQFKINGNLYDAKGDFTYNLGRKKRSEIVGSDGIHGFKEEYQAAKIEGEITDRGTLNLDDILDATDVTVILEVANGKTVVLHNAWFTGDGDVNTGEGNLGVSFMANSAEEILA